MEGKEVEKLEVGQDMAGIDRTVEVGRTGVSRRTTGVVGEGQGGGGRGVEIGQGEVVQIETVDAGGDIEGGDRVGQAVGNQEVVEMEVEEGGDRGEMGNLRISREGDVFLRGIGLGRTFFIDAYLARQPVRRGIT